MTTREIVDILSISNSRSGLESHVIVTFDPATTSSFVYARAQVISVQWDDSDTPRLPPIIEPTPVHPADNGAGESRLASSGVKAAIAVGAIIVASLLLALAYLLLRKYRKKRANQTRPHELEGSKPTPSRPVLISEVAAEPVEVNAPEQSEVTVELPYQL